MDWRMAIGRQQAALRSVVAGLVAMVGAGSADAADAAELAAERPTLARHRHRALLRLVRPAEAAARRLIIALALAVPAAAENARPAADPSPDTARPSAGPAPDAGPAASPVAASPPSAAAIHDAAAPKPPATGRPRRAFQPRQPRTKSAILRNGIGTGIVLPRAVAGQPSPVLPAWAVEPPRPPRGLRLPLTDAVRRVRVRRVAMRDLPRIAIAGLPMDRPPRRPLPTPDDRLDATHLILRIRALARALEDLPGEARRFRRWHARNAAAIARARAAEDARDRQIAAEGERCGQVAGRHRYKAGLAGVRLVHLPGGLGLAGVPAAPPPALPHRVPRLSPLRRGRPPGGRRKPRHAVHSILAEANELAHMALRAHDTS